MVGILSDRAGTRRLGVEALEARLCLSCTFDFDDGIVRVRGDDFDNDIVVFDDGAGGIDVECDGDAEFFDSADRVVVRARGGDDVVDYVLEDDLISPISVRINLGSGFDDSILDFSDTGNLGIFADLDLKVNANSDEDIVEVALGFIEDALVRFRGRLGDGNDELTAFLDGDLVGFAELDFAVSGGNGDDLVELFAEGSPEFNDILLDPDTFMALALNGEDGFDEIFAFIRLNSDSEGTFLADVNGNERGDDLTLVIFDEFGDSFDDSFLNAFDADLDGGTGFDVCDATSNVDVHRCEDVFIGDNEGDFGF